MNMNGSTVKPIANPAPFPNASANIDNEKYDYIDDRNKEKNEPPTRAVNYLKKYICIVNWYDCFPALFTGFCEHLPQAGGNSNSNSKLD
jgi:hypothetical protein